MHVEASTQISHPFAEAGNKLLLLFANLNTKSMIHLQSK
jgi:hypothetical protein